MKRKVPLTVVRHFLIALGWSFRDGHVHDPDGIRCGVEANWLRDDAVPSILLRVADRAHEDWPLPGIRLGMCASAERLLFSVRRRYGELSDTGSALLGEATDMLEEAGFSLEEWERARPFVRG